MFDTIGGLFALVSFVCWLLVLIHAFNNSIWKGIVALLCGLYWIYYAIVEYEHQHKWVVVLLAILGGGGATFRHLFR